MTLTPRCSTLLTLLPLLALLAPLAGAQRTWIVDANRGAGYDHATIQAAIDAAKNGDVLVIRAGSYDGFDLSKGLRLLAEPNVTVTAGGFVKPVRITGVATGTIAVLRGLTVKDEFGIGGVFLVHGNAGSVHLEELIMLAPATGAGPHSLNLSGNAAVSLRACNLPTGISIGASSVMATDCKIGRIPSAARILGSRPAIDCASSRVTVARSTVTGEDGFPPYNEPQPAASVRGTFLRILGDASSVWKAGTAAFQQRDVPAVTGDAQSSLETDSRIQLVPFGNAKPWTGFGTVRQKRLPHMGVAGGRLGGSLDVALHGAAQDFYCLSFSLPATPFAWPPLGDCWLDLATWTPLTAGLHDATGTLALKLPVPSDATLRGLPLAWQACGGPWPGIELANAAVVTVQ